MNSTPQSQPALSELKSITEPGPLPGVSFHASRRGGEVGRLIREKDWSLTPLGARETWPRSLQSYVSLILELPSAAIIFWGPRHYQIYNDGYALIMGPRHPQYLGGTYEDCWPETYPIIHPWMQRVLQRGETVTVERTLIPVTRHGFVEECYFTFSFTPIVDDDGRIEGVLQLVTEMTDVVLAARRETEARKKVEDLASDLRRAVEARDAFLGIASHELKTPLTSLKLQSQLNQRILEREGSHAFGPERIKKLIESPLVQANRLARLVDDMLDVSRIALGKLAMNFEHVELKQLITDTFERFAPQLNAAGCQVRFDLTEPIDVLGDAFRLEQVLTNLITNAIRYAPHSPVDVSLRLIQTQAILKVRDRGIGIPVDQLSRVFERFERFVSPNEVSGLGLGLHISKQIVEAHGGAIQVRSAEGEGAEFIVSLPVGEPGAPIDPRGA